MSYNELIKSIPKPNAISSLNLTNNNIQEQINKILSKEELKEYVDLITNSTKQSNPKKEETEKESQVKLEMITNLNEIDQYILLFKLSIKKNINYVNFLINGMNKEKLEKFIFEIKKVLDSSTNKENKEINVSLLNENENDAFSNFDYKKIIDSNDCLDNLHVKSYIKSYIIDYESSYKLFLKFELLFSYISNGKTRKTEVVKKIFWGFFVYLKVRLGIKKIIDLLLLITSSILYLYNILLNGKILNEECLYSENIVFNEDLNNSRLNSTPIQTNLQKNSAQSKQLSEMLLSALSLNSSEYIIYLNEYEVLIKRETQKSGMEEVLLRPNIENVEDDIEILNSIFNRISNDYDLYLKPNNFNEILLLKTSQSDLSPLKKGIIYYETLKNNTNENAFKSIDSTLNNNQSSSNVFKKLDFFSSSEKEYDQNNEKQSKHGVNYDKGINNFNSFSFSSTYSNNNLNNIANNHNILTPGGASPVIGMVNNFQLYTPITRAVNINKWITQYINNFQSKTIEEVFAINNKDEINKKISTVPITSKIEYISKLEEYSNQIEIYLKKYSIKLTLTLNQIVTFCLKLTEGLLKKNKQSYSYESPYLYLILNDVVFIKSIILVSFEIILYVENIQDIYFYKLAQLIDLDCYLLLKILNPIMTFDLMNIPNTIRYHLAEIEIQLLQFMIFSCKFSSCFRLNVKEFLRVFTYDNMLMIDEDKLGFSDSDDIEFNTQSLFGYIMNENEESRNKNIELYEGCINKSFELFKFTRLVLRKVLCYMLLLNRFICQKLLIDGKVCQTIEELIKSIILSVSNIDVVFERHVDQIVLYCIICVLSDRNDIRDKYNKVCFTSKEEMISSVISSYEKSKPDNQNKTIYEEIRLPSQSTARLSIKDVSSKGLVSFIENVYVDKVRKESSNEGLLLENGLFTNNSEESFKLPQYTGSISSMKNDTNSIFSILKEENDSKSNTNLYNLSPFKKNFLAYHYFFKTVFHSENVNLYSKSGITPMKSPIILNNRTANIKEIYNNSTLYGTTGLIGYNTSPFISLDFKSPKISSFRKESKETLAFASSGKREFKLSFSKKIVSNEEKKGSK